MDALCRGASAPAAAVATGAPPRPKAGRLRAETLTRLAGAGVGAAYESNERRTGKLRKRRNTGPQASWAQAGVGPASRARGERDAGTDQLLPRDPPDIPDPPTPLGPTPREPRRTTSRTLPAQADAVNRICVLDRGSRRVEHVSIPLRPRPGALGLWKVNVQRVPRVSWAWIYQRSTWRVGVILDPPTGTDRGSGGAAGPANSDAPGGGETPTGGRGLAGRSTRRAICSAAATRRFCRAAGTGAPLRQSGDWRPGVREDVAGRDYYRPVGSHEIQHLLHEYGCLLVFVAVASQAFGLPLPGTTALIAAALYAATAHGLPITGVIAAGAAGALAGTTAAFAVGRWGGEGLLVRVGGRLRQSPERVQQLRRQFACHGVAWLFIGRFISGVRNVTGLLAGASGMSLRRFFPPAQPPR